MTRLAPDERSLSVGIVGAGRIGTGLHRLFLDHGIDVVVVDAGENWDGLADRAIIVEAVTEDLDLKRSIIRDVQQRLDPFAVLSTTSSLTAAALSAHLPVPDRLLLWHPFNPVDRRRLVEVAAASTSGGDDRVRARQAAMDLAHASGRSVLEVLDSPGLVVNRILKRWTHAGLQALDDGWSAEAVDAAFVDAGFQLGPVSVVRLVGPAVSLAVSRNLASGLGDRFAPPQALVDAETDPSRLDRAGRDGDAAKVVEEAFVQIRAEIKEVLEEHLVAHAWADVYRAMREGAGWPPTVLERLHPG